MKLYLFVATDSENYWATDVWDEWTAEEADLQFAARTIEADEKGERMVIVKVPDDTFQRAFRPLTVDGEPTNA